MTVSASHSLHLTYESKCSRLHGHNWRITVFCMAKQKDENGMVVDFSHVKCLIHGRLDHGNLNELLDFNPTAENLAEWIVGQIPQCYKAVVEESEGNVAMCVDEQMTAGVPAALLL